MNVTIVIFVLVAVNVAGYALVYLALRSRLARTTSAREQIGEIADEVNRLVVDLNQTTDRNIALIEDLYCSCRGTAISRKNDVDLVGADHPNCLQGGIKRKFVEICGVLLLDFTSIKSEKFFKIILQLFF